MHTEPNLPAEVAQNPAVREVVGAVDAIEAYVNALVVKTPEQYLEAADRLKQVKAAQKKLDETRTAITGPMNAALKAVGNLFRLPGDRLARAERAIKDKLTGYSAEQDRLRREEQAKADAAARAEQERLAALARKAVESGRTAAAERHTERAAAVVAPVIHREAPKVAGVVGREVWNFKVENPALVPREFLMVDESKIRAYVRNMKADAKISGVRIYKEEQIAAGSR